MAQTLSASEARQNFSQLVQEALRGDSTIIEWHGQPVAAVIPIATFRQVERDRRALFDQAREVAARAALDDAAAMQAALDAQRAVRDAGHRE